MSQADSGPNDSPSVAEKVEDLRQWHLTALADNLGVDIDTFDDDAIEDLGVYRDDYHPHEVNDGNCDPDAVCPECGGSDLLADDITAFNAVILEQGISYMGLGDGGDSWTLQHTCQECDETLYRHLLLDLLN